VVKWQYGINIVTHYFKKNEYQIGGKFNPLVPGLNAYSDMQRPTQWCSWSRHHTTIRKVAGSIPNGVIGIIHLHYPSSHTMALGSTQPLTEMSTRNFGGGGGGGIGAQYVGLTTLPPSCGSLNLLEPSRPVQGLLYLLVVCRRQEFKWHCIRADECDIWHSEHYSAHYIFTPKG
jgi:hypothetical protein